MSCGGFRRICAFILAVFVVLSAQGCRERGSVDYERKIIVAVGIAPLAYFTRRIGGRFVDVELMVPPGASPHIYQPDPRQMRKLSRASLFIMNGLGMEFWADKAIRSADNPNLVVVNTSEGLDIIDRSGKPGTGNPHVWLDPISAIHQVKMIRDALIQMDPVHATAYRGNARALLADLRKLHTDIQSEVERFRSRRFVAFHPAWSYFARRYGLIEEAVIEKSPGREPSPAEMRSVVDVVRRIKAKAFFAEPQFSTKLAEVIADETGARVIILDPLGSPPDFDYVRTMYTNLAAMSRVFR
ncbi:MAG: metal ABC transporter substrate-binding protein [Armatimonadota bacterium]